VSVLVRVVRQFREAAEAITLEKVLVLPDVPTMGARLERLSGHLTASRPSAGLSAFYICWSRRPKLEPVTPEMEPRRQPSRLT
jgi:hypothetical protein